MGENSTLVDLVDFFSIECRKKIYHFFFKFVMSQLVWYEAKLKLKKIMYKSHILGPKSHYFWQLIGKLIYTICHCGPCIFSPPLGFVYMKRYESTPFIITSTDCKTCKVFGWNKMEKLHWNTIVVPFCSFFRKIVPFLKFKHDFLKFLTTKWPKF